MKSGDRIHVKDQMFEGAATIMHTFTDSFYALQIELDEPDDDGHRVKMINPDVIVKPTETPLVAFTDAQDTQRYLASVNSENNRYGFKKDETYVIGVNLSTQTPTGKTVYVYAPDTLSFRGCMNADMFRVVEPFTEPEISEPVEDSEEREMQYEQLDLLDFM